MSHTSTEIKDALTKELPLHITDVTCKKVIGFVRSYEIRDEHPLAFNTPYLGLHKCTFTIADRDAYFSLYDVDSSKFTKFLSKYNLRTDTFFHVPLRLITNISNMDTRTYFQTSPDTTMHSSNDVDVGGKVDNAVLSHLKKVIADISTINNDFKVLSDPLNIFISYSLYCIYNSSVDSKLKYDSMFSSLMLWQYKFFTSLVCRRFHYKPNEDIMRAMYEGMNAKFDVKRYGTWKRVMEARAELFLSEDSIHKQAIRDYTDDKEVLYLISDAQTRIRNQVNLVMAEFMVAKDKNDKIGNYSTMGTDVDGELNFLDNQGIWDNVTHNVYNDAMSVNRFLDDKPIRFIASVFTNITVQKFRIYLISFSERTVKQFKSGEEDQIRKIDDIDLIYGTHKLIEEMIQVTFKYCRNNGIDIHNLPKVIQATKDVYSSSRISDKDILLVRDSCTYMTTEILDSLREATLTAYRTGCIMYIILLAYKYLR